MCLSILREHSIADKAEAIRQTRRVATGILVALTLIFIATLFVDQPGWPVLLLRAIAEAGMIGGLADWFAVEALFRRPLGLPIPHTALLPTNKDRVARSVGQFFTEHFLDPETARARVLRMEPALHAALQLSSKENALALSRYIVRAIDVLTRNANDIRTTRAIGARLREAVLGATSDAKLAKHIGNVMRASVGHDVTNRLLAFSRERFDSNRAGIEALLQDRSRWWIPSVIDRQLATLLVDGAISMIDELSVTDSKLRHEFDGAMVRAIDHMTEDGTLAEAVTNAKSYLTESGAFDELTETLAGQASQHITDRLRDSPEDFAIELSIMIRRVAKRIAADPETCAEINSALADITAHLTREFRPNIGNYVTSIISEWDSADLIHRFESEVGRDLQFIRINGAVLGGLIGGVIFAVGKAFS